MSHIRRPGPHVLAPEQGNLAIRYVLVDGRTVEELLPSRYTRASALRQAKNDCMLTAYRAATVGLRKADGSFSVLAAFRAVGDGVRRAS